MARPMPFPLSPAPAEDSARPLSYRPEVDGLRALAVLSVLFFHAQLGPFAGGFVGVDVFFVISGFLITGILLREQAQERFSLAGFYSRRARRIGPALLAVSLACIVPAWLWMDARELNAFFRLLASVAVGGSNFVLAATTGYFDGPAEDQPLLHTWSLGVEEQFYVVFPLLLIATARWARRSRFALLALLALASLALAQHDALARANANFFLPFGRAWELLAGSLAAMAAARAQAVLPRVRQGLAALGVALIASAVFGFDRATPSPGVALLLPVSGAVLVLLWADARTAVGRLLAAPPLVGIGLVSYSVYLWHQPLLAFSRIALGTALPPSWRWGVIAASLLLAALTWRFVEQPFRGAVRTGERRTLVVAGAASLAMVMVGGLGVLLAARMLATSSSVIAAAFEPPPRTAQCFDLPQGHARPEAWCAINADAETGPSFALYGDSHALQLLESFEAAARSTGRTGLFAGFSACPPLLEVVLLYSPDRAQRDCEAMNRQMLAQVQRAGIRDVYLVAKWSYYTEPWSTGFVNALGRTASDPATVESSRRAFRHGYEATVRAYAAAGVRLHVVEQVPQQENEPRAVYRRLATEGRAPALLADASVTLARHHLQQAFASSVLRASDLPQRELLNFDDVLCDGERCAIGTSGNPFYKDRSHLSAAGAQRLVPSLVRSLRRRDLVATRAN
jgi:peptidoglycan/LPS O-acetylase OafA/YrhL